MRSNQVASVQQPTEVQAFDKFTDCGQRTGRAIEHCVVNLKLNPDSRIDRRPWTRLVARCRWPHCFPEVRSEIRTESLPEG